MRRRARARSDAILAVLRRGEVVTARRLAAAAAVSERQVYRDIHALRARGVRVMGEPGVGYLLREPLR